MSLGQTTNVILLSITRLASIADSVLPAPVSEKFPKYGSLLILYATYLCIRVGGYGKAYSFGISILSIVSYSNRNVSVTVSWNFLPVLPIFLISLAVVPFSTSLNALFH